MNSLLLSPSDQNLTLSPPDFPQAVWDLQPKPSSGAAAESPVPAGPSGAPSSSRPRRAAVRSAVCIPQNSSLRSIQQAAPVAPLPRETTTFELLLEDDPPPVKVQDRAPLRIALRHVFSPAELPGNDPSQHSTPRLHHRSHAPVRSPEDSVPTKISDWTVARLQ